MAEQQPPQASPGCEPPAEAGQTWYRRPIVVVPAVVLALGIGAWVVTGNGGTTTSAGNAPATRPPENRAAAAAGGSTKPSPSKQQGTKPGQLPTARLGATIQFKDSLGKRAADITVLRKKVGSNSPSGSRVGLLVRVKAFQRGIAVPRFAAVERGRRFDATCCTAGFEPELRVASTLRKGQTAQGWVIFDLPKANGRLVMQPLASSEAQAFWVF